MQYTDGEFIKEIQVEEGTDYQYKFRMGPGDWWVLCDDSPTGMWIFSPLNIDDVGRNTNSPQHKSTDNAFLSNR